MSLNDAFEKINDWVSEYNNFRPHSSLNEMTAQEFIERQEQQDQKREGLPGGVFMKLCVRQQQNIHQLHWKIPTFM